MVVREARGKLTPAIEAYLDERLTAFDCDELTTLGNRHGVPRIPDSADCVARRVPNRIDGVHGFRVGNRNGVPGIPSRLREIRAKPTSAANCQGIELSEDRAMAALIELPDWRDASQPQEGANLCVPWSYQWMLRYAKVPNISFDTFQRDFDRGTSNSLGTVAAAIESAHRNVQICVELQDSITDKLATIRRLTTRGEPCIISLATRWRDATDQRRGAEYHVMPVIGIKDEAIRTLYMYQEFSVMISEYLDADIRRNDETFNCVQIAYLKHK